MISLVTPSDRADSISHPNQMKSLNMKNIALIGTLVIVVSIFLLVSFIESSPTPKVETQSIQKQVIVQTPKAEAVYISSTPTFTPIPTTIPITPTKTPVPTTNPVKAELAQPSPKLTLSPTRVPTPIAAYFPSGCQNYRDKIYLKADRYGVRRDLFYQQLVQEGNCQPDKISPTDDCGVAQIHMPVYTNITLAQCKDPYFSIDWAAKKMGYLIKKYNDETWALRYYNCGESFDVVKYPNCGVDYANKILTNAK